MYTVHLRRGFVIFLLCIVVFSIWGVQWKTLGADFEDVDSIQKGDILFVDIYEGWSHGGFWDHLGLYVGGSVIEATFNGGITRTSLSTFLKRDGSAKIGIRRPKLGPDKEETIRKVIDYALAQVGKPFDFTATTSFPVKFNEDNLSCTELIWRAFKAADIDLDVNDGLFIYPDDIYFSPKLKKID